MQIRNRNKRIHDKGIRKKEFQQVQRLQQGITRHNIQRLLTYFEVVRRSPDRLVVSRLKLLEVEEFDKAKRSL